MIVNFSDSDDDSVDENLKSCTNETDIMMTKMKKESDEAATTGTGIQGPRVKRHKWDLRIPASTRNILAKRLEDYLDERIEIDLDLIDEKKHQKSIVSRYKKFRLSSSSTVKLKDSEFIDTYHLTVKRKPIPVHCVDSKLLSSAVSPQFDITKLLNSVNVGEGISEF